MRQKLKIHALKGILFALIALALMPSAHARCEIVSGSINYIYRFGQNTTNNPNHFTNARIKCDQDTDFIPARVQSQSTREAINQIRKDMNPRNLKLAVYVEINELPGNQYRGKFNMDFTENPMGPSRSVRFRKGITYVVGFTAVEPYINSSVVSNARYYFEQPIYTVGNLTSIVNGGFNPAPPETICPALRFSASVTPSPNIDFGTLRSSELRSGKKFEKDFTIQLHRTETSCKIVGDLIPKITLSPSSNYNHSTGEIRLDKNGLLLQILNNTSGKLTPVTFNTSINMSAMSPQQSISSIPFKAIIYKNPHKNVEPGPFNSTLKFIVTYR